MVMVGLDCVRRRLLRHPSGRSAVRLALALTVAAAAACGGKDDGGTPVATPTVTLNKTRASLGSPLEVTYKFVVAPGATFDTRLPRLRPLRERRRRADVDRRPRSAAADEDVEGRARRSSTRAPCSCRAIPYNGRASVVLGLYAPRTARARRSAPRTRGLKAYDVAGFELVPQGENVFLIYKDETWHPAEDARDNGAVSWRWSQQGRGHRLPQSQARRHLLPAARRPARPAAGQAADGHRSASARRCWIASFWPTKTTVLRKVAIPAAAFGTGRHGRADHRRRLDLRSEECAGCGQPGRPGAGRPGVPRLRRAEIERDDLFHAGPSRSAWRCLALAASPPRPAADLVVLSSGRVISASSVVLTADTATIRLRGGGEVTCDRSLVVRVDPDETPWIDPRSRDGRRHRRRPATAPGRDAVDAGAGRAPSRFPPPIAAIITRLAEAHGVDARLIHAVISVESAYRPRARSRKGARGLMQLMPATARQYGVRNAYKASANLDAGVRHLKTLLDRFARARGARRLQRRRGRGAALRRRAALPRDARTTSERVLAARRPRRRSTRRDPPDRPADRRRLLTSLTAVGDREGSAPRSLAAAASRTACRRPPRAGERLVYSRPCGRVVIS